MNYDLTTVNELPEDDFVQIIGPVYEKSPWVAQRTWTKRPFFDRESLWESLQATVLAAPDDEKIALIRAHPDLVGRAAREGSLTPASTSEQASAGLTKLSPEEVGLFEKYNNEYHRLFGFPFVICVRENKKESILAAFPERLQNNRVAEIKTALQEIGKIARLRLFDLLPAKE